MGRKILAAWKEDEAVWNAAESVIHMQMRCQLFLSIIVFATELI